MSNIYVTEPPPSGKVILDTSRGEIEVELFADQCPLACKNFIALALEGYYDNQVWHRFVSDFIIQSGDPTGSGLGGESFYGQPFADEFHQRLRFNRRGLLGMANDGQPNSNGSQFFLTLGNTPELQGKHTLFGRIHNHTIYNLVALAESVGEVGPDERPLYPPKLRTIRVIDNPFDGQIQLRITREERLANQKRRRDAEAKRSVPAANAQRLKRKNTALLSFGEAEEGEEEDAPFKGPKSSHDLLKDDKRLARGDDTSTTKKKKKAEATAADQDNVHSTTTSRTEAVTSGPSTPPLADIRREHAEARQSSDTEAKIAELEASLRHDYRRAGGEGAKAKEGTRQSDKGKSLLDEMRSRYVKGKAASSHGKKDEQTAQKLRAFQDRLRGDTEQGAALQAIAGKASKVYEELPEDVREYGEEEEEGVDLRGHRFDAGQQLLSDAAGQDDDGYLTIDPRDSSSSKAIQLGFGGQSGQERARQDRAREGRRGRDWVDDRHYGDRRETHRSKHSSGELIETAMSDTIAIAGDQGIYERKNLD